MQVTRVDYIRVPVDDTHTMVIRVEYWPWDKPRRH